MRARAIRETLQHNHDPKLVHCLCTIAETVSAQQQEIIILAELLDKVLDVVTELGKTTEVATSAVDAIRKQREN